MKEKEIKENKTMKKYASSIPLINSHISPNPDFASLLQLQWVISDYNKIHRQ
jgi:hypothetical protein